jgi:hypothetical protein
MAESTSVSACAEIALQRTRAGTFWRAVLSGVLSSSRENRVGHSVFFLYLDLCLPTTKKNGACGGLRLRRAYTLGTKAPPYKARASFLLLLFLFLSFSFCLFLPLLPPLLPLLAQLCLLSLIIDLGLIHFLSQECRQVSPFGTRRRTISIGVPKGTLDITRLPLIVRIISERFLKNPSLPQAQ